MSEQVRNAVLIPPTPAAIRNELQRLVVADLRGPLGGEFEEFGREAPTERYLLARLAPQGTMIEPDDLDENPAANDVDPTEPSPEPAAPNITSLSPSSLGCTVYLAGNTTELTATASWASYERVASEYDTGPSMLWRRKPAHGQATVTLEEGDLTVAELNPDYSHVVLESVSGGDAADRAEQRRLAMAHRHTPEFATGHGAAVHVTTAPGDPMRAIEVRTESVPAYEIPFTDVPAADTDQDLPGLAGLILDMKDLAEVPDNDLGTGLTSLVTAYRDWIAGQEATLADPERHLGEYIGDAQDALTAARRAAMRIEAGIELIKADERARRAFRFANRAMHLQRVHIIAAQARQKNKDLTLEAAVAAADIRENRSWRPFQLAFLLLNLPSLTDPAHPERAVGPAAVADLLWFPTGGGKTEAYLGLTAYTLAIRRLQPDLGGLSSVAGVAVLMRYTLIPCAC